MLEGETRGVGDGLVDEPKLGVTEIVGVAEGGSCEKSTVKNDIRGVVASNVLLAPMAHTTLHGGGEGRQHQPLRGLASSHT